MAKNNNMNWWLLISVAIVVAVVASIITANITGNLIKLKEDRFGKNLVYTKQDVDKMMKEVTDYQASILNQLNELDKNVLKKEPNNVRIDSKKITLRTYGYNSKDSSVFIDGNLVANSEIQTYLRNFDNDVNATDLKKSYVCVAALPLRNGNLTIEEGSLIKSNKPCVD